MKRRIVIHAESKHNPVSLKITAEIKTKHLERCFVAALCADIASALMLVPHLAPAMRTSLAEVKVEGMP